MYKKGFKGVIGALKVVSATSHDESNKDATEGKQRVRKRLFVAWHTTPGEIYVLSGLVQDPHKVFASHGRREVAKWKTS